MFTPVKLGNTTLPPEVLKADKKSCKRYGPCGVGEQALYLNSFFIDRRYYVALESVRRVFKRVAMSKGGFTGKGAFGSIPYLVVELDGAPSAGEGRAGGQALSQAADAAGAGRPGDTGAGPAAAGGVPGADGEAVHGG